MPRTPVSLLLDEYSDFLTDGMRALTAGDNEYAGSAQSRAPSELIREVLEECVDASVWAYLTYRRVKSLAQKIGTLEAVITEEDSDENGENYLAICTNKHGQYVGPDYEDPISHCGGGDSCGCACPDADE
jgi:hypothetical protein